MTSKERMLVAMQRGTPDRVPCAPDISTMVPQRLKGKPFWEIEMNQNPPLWRAYIDAVKHFGIDGWFIYGTLDWRTNSQVKTSSEIVSHTDERVVVRYIHSTPAGNCQVKSRFSSPIRHLPRKNRSRVSRRTGKS